MYIYIYIPICGLNLPTLSLLYHNFIILVLVCPSKTIHIINISSIIIIYTCSCMYHCHTAKTPHV